MTNVPVDSPQLVSRTATPNFEIETRLIKQGYTLVCGVDEAGRGPLAGPVTAAAVMLNPENIPQGLNDSKKLTEAKRNFLFDEILRTSHVSFAQVSAQSIDVLNIREASLLAMKKAIAGLEVQADYALIDGNALPKYLPCEASALVKGDARSVSIAAASIVAKVTRDRLMVRAADIYKLYGFEGHKGYPTKLHRMAVATHGPSPMHRQSFAPVAAALKSKKPDS